MKKLFIIGNPHAGQRKLKKIFSGFKEFLESRNVQFEFHDTEQSKSALKTVSEKLDKSYSDLIVIGGDGTINESINGLNFDIPVSIIPSGTGNDFIKTVELGKNLEQVFETALTGMVHQIDLGQCNDRKFVNGVGIGFDGQIVEDMATKRVPLLSGHAAYYYHVLRILGGYKERPFQYQIDNQKFEKDLILLTIGNGTTFGGGFKLMPEAKIDDGLLEICEIGKISGLRRFLNIHKLSNGTHGSLEEIEFYRAKSINVEANEALFAHIDGERMGQPPFEIKVLPGELKLRVTSF
ncbi:diacylglycerol/lipid kinase family protein [Ekhidna sp.]|uniref:diacylglycerol/lipid kinase family protein n=1 Tax=Ekhidna sp. TaxID=2608089 RepID=UPI003B50CB6F